MTLLEAARHAINSLAETNACVHGPEFDSAAWGNDCSVCLAIFPLVLAVESEEDTRE